MAGQRCCACLISDVDDEDKDHFGDYHFFFFF